MFFLRGTAFVRIALPGYRLAVIEYANSGRVLFGYDTRVDAE